MTGGLLNIISYGINDLYLTGAPQITFFKIVYRRHTNFSIESMEIGLSTTVNFNEQYEIIVDRYGDLIGNTYLKIKLPEKTKNNDVIRVKEKGLLKNENDNRGDLYLKTNIMIDYERI